MRLAVAAPRPARPRPGRLRGAQRGDPPHRARHPAHQGQDLLRRGATATATRSPRTTSARWPRPYVTVNGERSRYFGPDGSYESRGNGATFNNLDSDFFFQRIKDDRVVEKLLEQPPPLGPAARDPRGRARLRGRLQRLPAPRSAWTGSPTRAAAARRGCGRSPRSTPTGASTSSRCWPARGVAIDGIAQAPAARRRRAGPGAARRCPRRRSSARSQDRLPLGDLGSNAVALGKKATERRQGAAARQPALPLGRARALLPGAAHDPRQDRRGRRVAVRRAARS